MTSIGSCNSWDAVVVTCATVEWTVAVRKEILLLKKHGILDSKTSVLVVEDAEVGVGSGGATLNAVLVAAEHLSAKRGFMVLNADVFADSSILILHNGRRYPYEPCGKTFIPLPGITSALDFRTNLCNLLTVLKKLRSRVKRSTDCGVWVCSTDALLNISASSTEESNVSHSNADCVLFAIPCTLEYATNHGVLKLTTPDVDYHSVYNVENILYCRPVDELSCCALPKFENKVPLVAGIVSMSPALAESLLTLNARAPITSCTYLGTDSGTNAVQVSLFFDMLAAMATDIEKGAFVRGDCGKTYGIRHLLVNHLSSSMTRVRNLVFEELRKYKMSAVVLNDFEHLYWSEQLSPLTHMAVLKQSLPHKSSTFAAQKCIAINSVLQFVEFNDVAANLSEMSVIQNCILKGSYQNPIIVGLRSLISGLEWTKQLTIPSDTFLMCTRVDSKLCDFTTGYVIVAFGITDNPCLPYRDPKATVCNVSWQLFFERTGITVEDLWDVNLSDDCRKLFTAKLYPVCSEDVSVTNIDVLCWFNHAADVISPTSKYLEKWRVQRRVSLMEILEHVDVEAEFAFRRKANIGLATIEVRSVLLDAKDGALLALFRKASIEDWAKVLLDELDDIAIECDRRGEPGKVARVLANIADLLGCLAANEGGLRSGPAANKDWTPALSVMKSDVSGSIEAGVRTLKTVRNTWLNSTLRLIRAARHYEGASQILVQKAVHSASESVRLTPNKNLPDFGVWVVCECPARIDLSGGWTDTPPICYELGGSVVNVSILLDGKLPIGAKACRISDPCIRLYSDDGGLVQSLEVLDHLLDYDKPSSPGALVKACILYAKVVDVGSRLQLDEQLRQAYGGGFEIYTWSNLPCGSGLGTSSILAGAVLAALWLVTGTRFDRLSVIHAVLCVEQMLTTGGGWQDQVAGLMGGVLHGTSAPVLPLRVDVKRLSITNTMAHQLQRHLVLVYTGKVRLAKNLLQNVLRNWFARDDRIYDTFQALHRLSHDFANAIQRGDLKLVGELMNKYWELKKILASGAEPTLVSDLMHLLKPHIYGQLLCGAGGGGYMVLLTKEPDMHSIVRTLVSTSNAGKGVVVSDVTIDFDGLRAAVDGTHIEID